MASLVSVVPSTPPAAASAQTTIRISAGSTKATAAPDGAWLADTGYGGGRVKSHSAKLAIAATDRDWLYQKHRYNMGTYEIRVSTPDVYRVELHFAETVFKAPNARVFDVTAEGTSVIDDLDVFAEVGRAAAYVRAFEVPVTDAVLTLEFLAAGSGYPFVSGIELRPADATTAPTTTAPTTTAPTTTAPTTTAPTTTAPTTTAPTTTAPTTTAPTTTAPTTTAPTTTAPTTTAPTTTAPTTTTPPPPGPDEFPSPATTGYRLPESGLVQTGSITSSFDGQVIEGKDVTGKVRIVHDNVTVRDSRVNFTATYGLHVAKKSDGSCPVGTIFEYVEVNGALADESFVPVYGTGCAWTLDHAYVHNVGRAIKLVNDNVVTNSYIVSSKTGDSGSHRGAVGLNGGRNNAVINNVLMCEGTGCSAAIPMYGDFAPIDGMLVQHNLLATTGSYCAYGGSLSGKPYPDGSNVKFIDNHFSVRYFPTCGRYGHLSGFENNVRGNEFRGNVWHESGEPIN